jgi:hypothetical protein
MWEDTHKELLLAYGETPPEEGATLDYSADFRIRGKYSLLFFRMYCRLPIALHGIIRKLQKSNAILISP